MPPTILFHRPRFICPIKEFARTVAGGLGYNTLGFLCRVPGLVALLLATVQPLQACKHRAVWFWRDTGNPFGSQSIVGNPAQENQTVGFFASKGVKRVYGSYGGRPVTEPAVIAAWNAKLHQAGIQSQALMSENTWIFDDVRPALLTHITDRVINFNNAPGRTAAQRFDGLHLDIEPQGLPEWSTLTPAQKRAYLLDLAETFAAVRAHFVSAGLPAFPVFADLPVWFDNLPADGGSVGWLNATDRDQWFLDIAESLTGISLMPFERLTFSSINSGVSWERANCPGAEVRVGIEADIGPGQTWPTMPDFNNMMETMETAYENSGAVDIQSYSLWREAIAAQPLVAVPAVMLPASPLPGGTIIFTAEPGWTHLLLYSSNLCSWQEVQRFRNPEAGPIAQPVPFVGPKGFWVVQKFQERE